MSKRKLLEMYFFKSQDPGVINREEMKPRSGVLPTRKKSLNNIVRNLSLTKNTLLYLCIETISVA